MGVAWAHVEAVPETDLWWTLWNWDVLLLTGFVLSAAVYAAGLRRIWRKAGPGKGISRRQCLAFACAWVTLFVALASPIEVYSGRYFSVHMVQHLLILMVAAPLLAVSAPYFVAVQALPQAWRRRLLRKRRMRHWRSARFLLWHPLLAWTAYAVTLWVWHLPAFYQATLDNRWVHDAQHALFLLTATLFWWALVHPIGRLRLHPGAGMLYLFTTSLHGGVLGLLMTFSPRPWYPAYGRTEGADLLADQQIAGALMWMPAGTAYAVLAAFVFYHWLKREVHEAPRVSSKEEC
jgi:putative membrane protein